MKELSESALKLKNCLVYGLLALLIGAAVGVLDAVFGRGLLLISAFRDSHLSYLLPFLALAGLLIVFLYQKFGRGSEKGMGLVFAVGHGEEDKIPLRLVPLVLGSTWLTHLFGGSAGREGVAVQIGATVSHWISKRLCPKAGRIFLAAGMAAGFAGIFRTPIAAVFFAVEVLYVGKIDYRALFPSFIAAFTASQVAGLCGLGQFTAEVGTLSLSLSLFLKLLALGFIFGLCGKLFAGLLRLFKRLFASWFKNPYLRIAIIGVCLSSLLFLLHEGRYCGLGTNLITAGIGGGEIRPYDWILKLLLTTATLAAGFQGGEVTPLFSIGASLGAVLALIFNMPVALCAALGYASVFGSASKTYLAPILIGAEVFGFETLPLFFIVCTAAQCFSSDKSIYSAQKIME